jgi:hypothetical protein
VEEEGEEGAFVDKLAVIFLLVVRRDHREGDGAAGGGGERSVASSVEILVVVCEHVARGAGTGVIEAVYACGRNVGAWRA